MNESLTNSTPGDPLERALARGAGDLPVPAEALSKFRVRAAGDGLVDVAYRELDSPVGRLILAATDDGLVKIGFDTWPADETLAELAERISPRVVHHPARLDSVARQLDEFFAGRRRSFDLQLDWSLIDGFRREVLYATERIAYGEVRTYGEMAREAGSERAARAAGSALASNPLPLVVPCHRVVRAGGAIGQYGGGVERKRLLLELEGAIRPSR